MQYTSELKRLVLPEYGRNVQQMVDHCMTIEDKAERTRCANTIINIMGNLFPHLRDIEDFKHKLWDHLAIMSDFKLDIDYPYEIIKKENLHTVPESVPSHLSNDMWMHRDRSHHVYTPANLSKSSHLPPNPYSIDKTTFSYDSPAWKPMHSFRVHRASTPPFSTSLP